MIYEINLIVKYFYHSPKYVSRSVFCVRKVEKEVSNGLLRFFTEKDTCEKILSSVLHQLLAKWYMSHAISLFLHNLIV
jgi:hypothetical protein